MNTFLSSEQQALQAQYRAFATEHIAPHAKALDSGSYNTRDIIASLGQQGYLGMCVPKEYGGQALPFLNFILLVEAIGEVDPGIALAIAGHAQVVELLSKWGTDKQKSRYLPLLARGECLATLAVAEETAGSDFSAVKSTVQGTKDKLTLTGQKTWVVNGPFTNLALVMARYKESAEDQGRLSFWLVDMDNRAELKVGSNQGKLGLRSATTCPVTFNGLSVNPEALLCEKRFDNDEQALDAIRHAQSVSKVIMAASAVGLLEHAVDESVQRARTREQFGSTIGKLQAIQWKLADMSVDSSAARLMTYRAAWSKDEKPEQFSKYAAMCKLFAARGARLHSSEAVQIFGVLGLSDDEPVEKLYRDAKALEIVEGTSEIQKNIIAGLAKA